MSTHTHPPVQEASIQVGQVERHRIQQEGTVERYLALSYHITLHYIASHHRYASMNPGLTDKVYECTYMHVLSSEDMYGSNIRLGLYIPTYIYEWVNSYICVERKAMLTPDSIAQQTQYNKMLCYVMT